MRDVAAVHRKLEVYESRLDKLEKSVQQLPTKDDIAEIVRTELLDAIFKTGRFSKSTIITLATIFGSFAIIGGVIKWIAMFFGIQVIK